MLRTSLFLLAILLSCVASAQFDAMGMMRKMMTSPSSLLVQPEVKKELKLSGDQNKKISAIQNELQKKTQELTKASGKDLSVQMTMSQKMEEANDEASKAIVAVLDSDQNKRLSQIQIQILGGACLFEPDTQKALGLTDDQVAKIEAVHDGESAHMTEIMQQNMRDPKAMKQKMKAAREERDAALYKVLTEAQASKLKELQGPPSDAAKKVADRLF